jgi:hypothetical protein
VNRSLALPTTGRQLSAAAGIHPPDPNGCGQSCAVTRTPAKTLSPEPAVEGDAFPVPAEPNGRKQPK